MARLHPMAVGLALGVSVVAVTPASRATGFLDLNSDTWTTTPSVSACPSTNPGAPDNINCYIAQTTRLDLYTAEGGDATLAYKSSPVPNTSLGYNISFKYIFDSLFGIRSAYYKVGSTQYALGDTNGTESVLFTTATLGPEEALEFGVSSGSVTEATQLSITSYSYQEVEVPAPLPLLGAAASFGWIRRRRAMLKAPSAIGPQP